MKVAAIPENELERQASLDLYQILDTLSEPEYDTITALAAFICGTPIALVSLIDHDRQWFKSHHGLAATETPRDIAFCAHAILNPEDVFIVGDAREDERFFDNPLTTGDPHVVFYAGAPLVTSDGKALGTLCVIDQKPNALSLEQMKALTALSDQVVTHMELRKKVIELEVIQQELQTKNLEISRFAHLVSHDLRSPLNAISALSDFVLKQNQESLNDVSRNGLLQLKSKAQQAIVLVDGMLTHAIEGQAAYRPQLIQMAYYVKSLIDFCSPPNDIQISMDIQVSEITTDPTILHQILQNLIGNAIKYNDKTEGQIHIIVAESPSEIIFEVIDNGLGIPKASHCRIFGMMQIVAKQDRFGKKGTGIGLNTVKNLVENLRGRIELESTVGVGSTFRVILPRE